jgi:hypothetical protein
MHLIKTINLAIFLILLCATERAGADVFTPQVMTIAEASLGQRDTAFTAAEAPAISQVNEAGSIASAVANFTELNVLASKSTAISPSSVALAIASDTLTIAVIGAPAGATRLELTWQISGTITGTDSDLLFSSRFRPNTFGDGFPDRSAGSFTRSTPGTVNQTKTFIYDGVPMSLPFNVSTRLEAVIETGGPAIIDFSNTAYLTDVSLFVDDNLVPAHVIGTSGQTYSIIPEPRSIPLLVSCCLVHVFRRPKHGRRAESPTRLGKLLRAHGRQLETHIASCRR